MWMPGTAFLDRATDREVGGPGVFGMDAALQADLGRTAPPRFLDPPLYFGKVEIIGPATQIFAELALRESARTGTGSNRCWCSLMLRVTT